MRPTQFPKEINDNVVIDSNGCWVFQIGRRNSGYCVVRIDKRQHLVHRYVAGVVHGIPDGHDVHHMCRNRSCCNPSHLQVMTKTEHRRKDARLWRGGTETHYPCGHERTPENTYSWAHGRTKCKTCVRARRLARYHMDPESSKTKTTEWRRNNRDRWNAYQRELSKKKRQSSCPDRPETP